MPDLDKMSRRQTATLLSGMMMGLFLAALDQTIIATALPAISHDLGDIKQIPWVATSYLLASTIAVPMVGKLGDLFGRNPVFQFSVAVFVVGSIVCGFAGSMTHLIAGRIVQGIGAGGLLTMPPTILGEVVSPRNRGRYLGYIGVVWGLASIAGPSVGGVLTEQISWRWAFYINIPIGITSLVATTMFLKMPRRYARHRLDLLGFVLLAASSSCALLGLFSMGSSRANVWDVAILLSLAVLFLGAFIIQERRAAEPLLPLRLFGNSVVRVGIFLSVLVGVAMFITVTYSPMFLQLTLGHSISGSGFLLSPMLLTVVLTSFFVGRLISASGRYRIFPIIGTILVSIGFGALALASQGTNVWLVVSSTVVIAAGIGCIMQVVVLAIQNSVAHPELGVATSTERLFRSLGSAVGVAAAGVILALHLVGLPARAQTSEGSGSIQRFLNGADSGDLEVGQLTGEARELVGDEIADALRSIFLAALPLSLGGIAMSLRLRELPLHHHQTYRTTAADLVG